MSFPYKKVFMVGATSGIGKALTSRLASTGVHVIASGRRTENLQELQKQHGSDKISILTFDVTNLSSIDKVVEDVTKEHPDLDCLFLNAGIQRGTDFNAPETIDMKIFSEELTTNYTSAVALTLAFLPFFKKQNGKTSIVYTTSGLAITPLVRCAGYSGSKAAMHSFILCLRQQLKGSNTKIIELLPPAVQTELHDAKHQPDIKNGGSFGMPLDEFTDEAWAGLEKDEEQIFVQTLPIAREIEMKRQELVSAMWSRIKGMMP